MVRTMTRKLLECQNPEQTRFFDLETDPLEMNNLINDSAYADDIRELRDKLYRWSLFETRSCNHLDWGAAQSSKADIPGPEEVQKARDYYREQFYST